MHSQEIPLRQLADQNDKKEKMKSINPATGKTIKLYKEFTALQIESVLKNSDKSFNEWRNVPFAKKARLFNKASEILKKNKEKYASFMVSEMGKPIRQAIAEVEKCALVCEYFASNAEGFLKEEAIKTDYQKSYVTFEPLGLILAIMPWNFPFWQVFRAAAPTLMAGNVMVLKHASNVSGCAIAIEKIFKEAGFQKGVFSTVLVKGSDTEKLIADKRIAAVTITGSTEAGKKVAEAAGRNLKKVVLELGGSDPFIILKDADIEKAASTATTSRLINNGQSCIAAKRFIVEKTIYEKFKKLFVENFAKVKIGDPKKHETDLGPIAREDLMQQIETQVKASVDAGAKILIGGKRFGNKGYFYEATILDNVTPKVPAYYEEIFGPVASIIIAEDENDAIKITNDTVFGLGSSLWTKNIKKAEKLSKQINAGCVFINDMVKSDPRLPFGGIKESGYGRELSPYGIKEFVNIKTMVIK